MDVQSVCVCERSYIHTYYIRIERKICWTFQEEMSIVCWLEAISPIDIHFCVSVCALCRHAHHTHTHAHKLSTIVISLPTILFSVMKMALCVSGMPLACLSNPCTNWAQPTSSRQTVTITTAWPNPGRRSGPLSGRWVSSITSVCLLVEMSDTKLYALPFHQCSIDFQSICLSIYFKICSFNIKCTFQLSCTRNYLTTDFACGSDTCICNRGSNLCHTFNGVFQFWQFVFTFPTNLYTSTSSLSIPHWKRDNNWRMPIYGFVYTCLVCLPPFKIYHSRFLSPFKAVALSSTLAWLTQHMGFTLEFSLPAPIPSPTPLHFSSLIKSRLVGCLAGRLSGWLLKRHSVAGLSADDAAHSSSGWHWGCV